jgi:NADPH-dependent glutamate synthase beta subunit-like oxidoreductase
VELRTGTRVGRDIPFEELERDFDIVYLGVGAHKSLPLRIPGEEAEGVVGAVEFLRAYHLGKQIKVGKHVAVIGGGNPAIEAARVALRLGAKQVTIYYRRERKDMPAQEWEIKAAEEEGVRILHLVAPARIITQYGKAARLELTEMRLDQFDETGRKHPKPILGSEFTERAETVISAIGQAADLSFLEKGNGIELVGGKVKVDRFLHTTHPKVWAGGDGVTGPAMVIDAIKAGQEAARAIDKALRDAKGEKPWVAPEEEKIEIPFEVEEETVEQPQTVMPEASPSLRRKDFREVELGYTLEMAMAEARRCMRCDANVG